LTLMAGFMAPRHDLRTMLLLGAALMVATGAAFPQIQHIAFVLVVAFVGTIIPTPVTAAFWSRSSTRCSPAASPTTIARAPSPATASPARSRPPQDR